MPCFQRIQIKHSSHRDSRFQTDIVLGSALCCSFTELAVHGPGPLPPGQLPGPSMQSAVAPAPRPPRQNLVLGGRGAPSLPELVSCLALMLL